MTSPRKNRTTASKLAIFGACFTGLDHVYGTYDLRTGRARQVKAPVTESVMLRHLQGREPYGVYLLTREGTRAVVADFDEQDTSPPLEFIRQARHYGLDAYLERSKSKGWHVWVFTVLPGLPATKGRLVVKAILSDIGASETEVFPKQDHLADDTRFGNFIYAPLFGLLVPEGRTVFVDPDRGLKAYPDQWDVLENVRRVTEEQLDEIIEINDLGCGHATGPVPGPPAGPPDTGATFGLPPCAQRMLTDGVTEYQRVACFRLAVQLRKAGLPEDITVGALSTWAAKNHPTGGKRIITLDEIGQQARSAYARSYHGCGCEEPAITPYCSPACPIRPQSGEDSSRDSRATVEGQGHDSRH